MLYAGTLNIFGYRPLIRCHFYSTRILNLISCWVLRFSVCCSYVVRERRFKLHSETQIIVLRTLWCTLVLLL